MTSSTGPKRNEGFSLLELIIVILILGVMTGLAVPSLRGSFVHLQVRDCCWNLGALANYGRQRAIVERKTYSLKFDQDFRNFRLMRREKSGNSFVYFDLNGLPGKVFSLPERVYIRRVVNQLDGAVLKGREINFYPDGTADEMKVYFSEGSNDDYVVSVGREIGEVTVETCADTGE